MALLALFFYFLFSMQTSQRKNLEDVTSKQFQETFTNFLSNIQNRYSQQVMDYTYWDDMCDYLQTRDEKWAQENLATVVQNYGADEVLLFTMNDVELAYSFPDKGKYMPEVVKQARSLKDDLFRKRTLKSFFYDPQRKQVGVLYGATIHPSDDPQRLTNPQGFFFICKFWDAAFLNDIERMMGTKVKLSKSNIHQAEDDRVGFSLDLNNYYGEHIAFLQVEEPAPFLQLYGHFTRDMQVLFSVSAILLVLIVSLSLYYFIGKPLRVLQSSLRGKPESLPKLKQYGGEFEQIAEIIEESVTQQQELAKAKLRAEESDKLKSVFLSGISHEMRTPMNAIVGFSRLLPDFFDNKEQLREITGIIVDRSNDLLSNVNSIIDMSRISAGTVQARPAYFDVNVLFDELKASNQKPHLSSGENSVELIFNTPQPSLQLMVETDPAMLRDILTQLISNAYKFTEKGFIEVGVRIEENQEDVLFYVSDSGKGIPRPLHDKIFEQFVRLNQGNDLTYSGNGLGLSIVKGLIKLLNGCIWLDSSEGNGSTFYFRIPGIYRPFRI